MKKLELGVRNWFNRRYKRKTQPRLVTEPLDVLHLPPDARILFLRQDRIGDVLISTPVIKAVRECYPNAQIDVVLSRNNIAVENTMSPFTDKRYIYQKSLKSLFGIIVQLRKMKYHVVVDLLDNASSTSSIFTTACGAAESVGIQKENSGSYTICVPLMDKRSVHISERIALLLMPFGIDPTQVDLRPIYPIPRADALKAQQGLQVHPKSERYRLGVNISGSSDLRSLSVEKTCEVLQHIRMRAPGVHVFVFAAPRHHERLTEIIEKFSNSRLLEFSVIQPVPSFHEFASMLHEMNALWTPDTSAVHLAAAWSTPCCVMFNQHDPNLKPWLPYRTHCEAVINQGENLDDLSVSDITQSIDRLLAYCAFPVE